MLSAHGRQGGGVNGELGVIPSAFSHAPIRLWVCHLVACYNERIDRALGIARVTRRGGGRIIMHGHGCVPCHPKATAAAAAAFSSLGFCIGLQVGSLLLHVSVRLVGVGKV